MASIQCLIISQPKNPDIRFVVSVEYYSLQIHFLSENQYDKFINIAFCWSPDGSPGWRLAFKDGPESMDSSPMGAFGERLHGRDRFLEVEGVGNLVLKSYICVC